MNFLQFLFNSCKVRLSLLRSKCFGRKISNQNASKCVQIKIQQKERASEPGIEKKSSSGTKTVLVLYADDSEQRASQLATRSVSGEHQSSEAIFQLELINVQATAGQLSPRRQSIGFGSQFPALVCILISGTMANLINSDTSSVLRWLAAWPPADSDSDSHDYDRRPMLAFYDELNEINMFRIKYRLAACTYIATSHTANHELHRLVERACSRAWHEHLFRRSSSAPVPGEALFSVFPSQISEANAQVVLSLDECVPSGQLVDVLLNGRSTLDSLALEWTNRGTLCFTVPGELLKNDSLCISVAINCASFLGTRAIKCERESPIDCGNLISSLNSANYLCDSLGAQSVHQLDHKLAQVFDESLARLLDRDSRPCDLPSEIFFGGTDQLNESLPTWLHLASACGLRQLTASLLKWPASATACFTRNSAHLRPIDVAIEHGHWDIVRILNHYTKQIELVQLGSAPTEQHVAGSALLGSSRRVGTSAPPDAWARGSQSPISLHDGHSTEPSVDTNQRIMEAKNGLLLLIEQFKCGISIECFEQMFSNWEATYKDVLEGQMSLELQYSLNEIKKLCAEEDGL